VGIVNDSARVLLVAAILSTVALAAFAVQIDRAESDTPPRLIGQMRLAHWAALLLASSCGLSLGFIVADGTGPLVGLDTTVTIMLAGVSALAIQREPRPALATIVAALVAHVFVTIAHRPGWLPADAFPRWYAVGSAAYDTAIAAVCAWTWRR
jgi:hypothetical protein